MKIKALRNTAASGQELTAGEVYDVSEQDARILIQMGKAALYRAASHVTAAPATPEAPAAPAAEDPAANEGAPQEDDDGLPKDPDLGIDAPVEEKPTRKKKQR